MVKMMITIINYHHHHCSHGVFIPLCCYSPSTCTCTSFVQCQWLPLTLTTPKYFCVVVLPRTFHILQGCISCNKNFSWYWTVFPLTSKGPTLLLCCSFHIQAGNVHELALFTPHHLHEYRINNLSKASVTFIFIPHVFSISRKLKSCISQN